ncbi:glycosyl transferase family 2 [Coriobacterium glomerans PW2]|uniref:Glycosyl transferase family 2 n=2 Tax=Coriobacterium TaxID=33870 RepID=F2N8L6_CORGP|nr:glycosyl transferase family 2 [Coriobacterium glomerans PW2]
MAHRASKRPSVSVIMAVHDARVHLCRAVESVLAADAVAVQVVIVDCASNDGTAALAARMAERDIRIDAIRIDVPDPASGLDRGLKIARGTYCMVMGQDDWFASHGLTRLRMLAETSDLELCVPELSVDIIRTSGERTSIKRRVDAPASKSAGEFHRRMSAMIESGVFDSVRGKLLRRDRVEELGLSLAELSGDLDFMVAYVESLERVGFASGSCYHLTLHARPPQGSAASRYPRCLRDHELLLGLAGKWEMLDNREFMTAVHRRYLSGIIACIEQTCASGARLCAPERNARIRYMLEERATRESILALHDRNRDFGFMYVPLARSNVSACCMGVRLVSFMRSSRLPLAPVLRDANVAWESALCAIGEGSPDGCKSYLEGDRA